MQKTEVRNAIKTRFESASECMRDGMFYNTSLEDCEPCSACTDSVNDGCFMQCQGKMKSKTPLEVGAKISLVGVRCLE